MFSKNFSRRDFLKNVGLSTLAINGALAFGELFSSCTTSSPKSGSSPISYSPGYESWNFIQSILSGQTPGIRYKFRSRTLIVAPARGKINRRGKPKRIPGHAGGYMVELLHTDNLEEASQFSQAFISAYFHLDKILVGNMEGPKPRNLIVERGQVLGYCDSSLKFTFKEHGNLVNPDDWGPNHSFMDYWDGKADLDSKDIIPKLSKQRKLLLKLHEAYMEPDKEGLLQRVHRKNKYYGTCFWSTVETWRFMMKKDPGFFNIPEDQLNQLNNEFYDNQPMILTLPFKRP